MELENVVKIQKYNCIIDRMRGRYFSWAMAKHIVGGEKRLLRLMDEEKVHGFKPDIAINASWRINADEVLKNVKPNLHLAPKE